MIVVLMNPDKNELEKTAKKLDENIKKLNKLKYQLEDQLKNILYDIFETNRVLENINNYLKVD